MTGAAMSHAYQMTAAEPVRAEDVGGGVRLITLDRPPANAIDESLLRGLSAALDGAADDDAVRALALTGAGGFFCGGFDLRAARRDAQAVTAMARSYRDTHRSLLAFPKPAVAMINGHAVAGGLVLALACEHRFAVVGDYRVGLNELSIGAAFPPVAMEILRLRLPDAALSELVLGARLHSASDLPRFGVVTELVPAAHFREHALALAELVGSYPRQPYAHAKQMMVAEALDRVDGVTDEAEEAASTLWSTDESRAARARQRERL
jgi:enoyl-CoA hydratase